MCVRSFALGFCYEVAYVLLSCTSSSLLFLCIATDVTAVLRRLTALRGIVSSSTDLLACVEWVVGGECTNVCIVCTGLYVCVRLHVYTRVHLSIFVCLYA